MTQPKPLSLEEIAALEAVEREATIGPWEVFERSSMTTYRGIDAHNGFSVVVMDVDGGVENDEDAELIAALRTAAPSLLQMARERHELFDALEAALGPADAIERFELLAEQFYRETRMMAPGKDVPAALYEPWTEDEKREKWRQWQADRIAKFRALLARIKGVAAS